MTYTYKRLTEKCDPLYPDQEFTSGYQLTIHHSDTLVWFQQMIERAFNCWDNAPPEAKAFADTVLHGKPLQDYQSMEQPMNTQKEKILLIFHPDVPHHELPLCPECGQRGVGHRADCSVVRKK